MLFYQPAQEGIARRLATSRARHCRRRLRIFGLCFVALLAVSAQAWNDLGHRAIAIGAMRLLPDATQQRVLATLKAHPRYTQDIEHLQPRGLGSFSAAEWQIGQAATWPDIARGFEHAWFWQRSSLRERYHRGHWHYINFPVYLDPLDQRPPIADPSVGCRDASCTDPANVLEALELIEREFADPATSAAQRGLGLAWALHLLGDAHQPLHSSALFDVVGWPRGDRGGNDLMVDETLNLHAFWDRALLATGGTPEIAGLVDTLTQGAPDVLPRVRPDIEALLRESHKVAKQAVYGPLLDQLRDKKSQLVLDADYRSQATKAALQQGQRAVLRTAAWLQSIFSDPVVGPVVENAAN